MNFIPYILEQSDGGERGYDIYSRLLKDRIILLIGEIDDSLASLIISELLYLDSVNNDDIALYINSPGGSVTAGLSIYDTMNFIKPNVITIGMGLCASMGAFLLSSGDKRYALENTKIMIHQPLGGAKGQASDIMIVAEEIIKIKKKLNDILCKNTKQKLEKIEKDTDRDFYMDSTEALNYGIIDEILIQKK
jgi:ATP-dependent Clp protease protease subunit